MSGVLGGFVGFWGVLSGFGGFWGVLPGFVFCLSMFYIFVGWAWGGWGGWGAGVGGLAPEFKF